MAQACAIAQEYGKCAPLGIVRALRLSGKGQGYGALVHSAWFTQASDGGKARIEGVSHEDPSEETLLVLISRCESLAKRNDFSAVPDGLRRSSRGTCSGLLPDPPEWTNCEQPPPPKVSLLPAQSSSRRCPKRSAPRSPCSTFYKRRCAGLPLKLRHWWQEAPRPWQLCCLPGWSTPAASPVRYRAQRPAGIGNESFCRFRGTRVDDQILSRRS